MWKPNGIPEKILTKLRERNQHSTYSPLQETPIPDLGMEVKQERSVIWLFVKIGSLRHQQLNRLRDLFINIAFNEFILKMTQPRSSQGVG